MLTSIAPAQSFFADDEGLNIWVPASRPIHVGYGDNLGGDFRLEERQEVANFLYTRGELLQDMFI